MAILSNKFKDRQPTDTIKIIQDFFIDLGLTVKVEDMIHSEADTYSCAVRLYKNDQSLLTTCGKGMTEAFCLASGYAELFERFNNKCEVVRHTFFMDKRQELTYKQFGYHIHPDEKILSYQEIMKFPMYQNFYKKLLRTQKNIEMIWRAIAGETIYAEPFYDLTNNNQIVYHNQRIANRITCSVGMSAGNTVEEALSQSISEICEHMVSNDFLLSEHDKYYRIDPLTLNNELQDKIKNIENAGSKLLIFDLSYNYNMPVVMSLLVNPLTQTTTMNFGSFPIFDIAVERVITEVYQGIKSFNTCDNAIGAVQSPYETGEKRSIIRMNSLLGLFTFNEKILNKSELVSFNKKIYLDKQDVSNRELISYFIDLFKEHNYSLHYINNSQSPDLAAVYVMVPEYDYAFGQFDKCLNYSDEIIYNHVLQVLRVYKFTNEILFNPQMSVKECFDRFKAIQNYCYTDEYDGHLMGTLTFSDWMNPIPCNNKYFYIDFDPLDPINSLPCAYHTIFYKPTKTYLTLRGYVITKQYTVEQIKNIMHDLFNLSVTNEDINRCFDQQYLMQKIIIEPIRNYVNSEEYLNIVQSTIKDFNSFNKEK